VENIPDVAVLHGFASMAFNNDRPAVSTYLYEQALIAARIPFDIVFDDNLKDLSKYRVLVLADQEALDDDKLELIRRFVERGGAVVGTEYSSLFDEWRRRRRDFGLKDLFGVAAPRYRGPRGGDQFPQTEPVRRELGKGRAVYIPEVKPAIAKPLGARMTSQYWKLPQNADSLVDAVKWAARGSISVEVKAPPTVVAEIMRQKSRNTLLVHLVNYDVRRTPVLRNLEVSVALPAGARVRSVTLLTPDEEATPNPQFKVAAGRVAFTVPRLATYELGAVQLEGK
jgi:hypothetical protein